MINKALDSSFRRVKRLSSFIANKIPSLSSKHRFFIALFIAFQVGLNIFIRSDMPPYSSPDNEGNNYWGMLIDIAHKWRSLDFDPWSRCVAGGLDLFAAGLYPLFNPFNVLAWFFNDDIFYLINLVLPYALGFFFMMLLLWDVFKTRWYIACFGGLAYMGLFLAKATPMAESPYFLYGCGLFPGMVLAAIKLEKRHIYLAAAGAGAMVALQFFTTGVFQMPQLTIFWSILFVIYFLGQLKDNTSSALKKLAITLLIFWGCMLGLSAVQLVPTWSFFKLESARLPGYYGINNFDLFNPGHNNGQSLKRVFLNGFIEGSGPIRTKMFLALIFLCLALSARNFGRIFEKTPSKKWVYLLWSSTIVYFLIPPTAGLLAKWIPWLAKPFSPLTYFSFHYGLHILDFCMMLTACLLLSDETIALRAPKKSFIKQSLTVLFALCTLIIGAAPLVLFMLKSHQISVDHFPWSYNLTPENFKNGAKLLFNVWILVFVVWFRPRHILVHCVLIPILLGSGFMVMIDCFKWYDKGKRTRIEEYQLDSPEHRYFEKAKGKYTIPYTSREPSWAVYNHNLLFGVNGTCGHVALAPLRLSKFAYYYNNRRAQNIDAIPFRGNSPMFLMIDDNIPSSFTTYFPIDFTLVRKGTDPGWNGFTKTVSGEKYDVYERSQPTPRVYFADQLKIEPPANVVKRFDEPRSSTLYVTSQDASRFSLQEVSLPDAEASYHRFKQDKDSRLSFETTSQDEVFAVVPERYAQGWDVRIDNRTAPIFPAYSLFIGFKIPPGTHSVELRYSTPWFWPGLFLSLLSIFGIALLFKNFYHRKNV